MPEQHCVYTKIVWVKFSNIWIHKILWISKCWYENCVIYSAVFKTTKQSLKKILITFPNMHRIQYMMSLMFWMTSIELFRHIRPALAYRNVFSVCVLQCVCTFGIPLIQPHRVRSQNPLYVLLKPKYFPK